MNFLTSRRKRKLLKKQQQARKRRLFKELQHSFSFESENSSQSFILTWLKNIPLFITSLFSTILGGINSGINTVLFPFLFVHQLAISAITHAVQIPTDAFLYARSETERMFRSLRASLKRKPSTDAITQRKLNQLSQELISLRKSHKKLKEEVKRLSTLQNQVKIIEKQVTKSIPKLNEIIAAIPPPAPPPPPPPMMAPPPPPPPLPAPISLAPKPLLLKKLNPLKADTNKGPALPQVSLALVLGAKGNLRSVRRESESLPAPKPLQDVTATFALRNNAKYSPSKKNPAKNSPQKPIFRLRNTGVLRSPGGTPYKENFEENVDSPANIITNALRNKFKNVRGSPDKSREKVNLPRLVSSPLVTVARDL